MSRIELQIVALGNFSSVQSEFAKLNAQVAALNKNFSGVGINATDVARIKQYTKEFDSALRSTGAFTAQQVQLQSQTEKFGKALEGGHLKLRQYFSIINQGATQSQGALRNLAVEQTKLQNSIIVKDPLRGGLATVYTPTIINQATNATKIATNQQKLYNMAIDRGATSLINWGKNTQWAGRQLTVGLTVPLTMFGSVASKVFQQMDQELTRMQKVYGTGLVQPSQAALSAIRKDISSLASELAKAWGTPIKETAAMAADLAATGKSGLELVNATREALRLATLGELDKQQAMQATVSLQNVYKLNTQELSEAVDFLNAVENQTSTSLQDLVDAIPRVGPIVAQMGGSFKDTAAMMVAMKEAGIPAAQSANAIKAALASIINPTKAAREAFRAYGIDVAAIAGNNKGNAVNMLADLQQKMKDLTPLAKEQLIEKMFGKFQMSRISALLDNLNKAGSQSKTVFSLMQASSSELAKMAEQELKTQTESTTGKYKRAMESLKADLLPIGEQFTKVITKIINFGDSIVKMLDKLGPMKNLLGFILGFVAVAGPLIMLTGVFGNLFGYIMKGISLFRNMRTEGAGLKGITGLLTAENIAASQASNLMSQKMLEEVNSTKLLASAIDQLNLKLESMVILMSKASQGGVGVATAQAQAMAVASTTRIKGSRRLPLKFATGGSVPGTGDYDTQPAMLTPGEFVVNKKAAQEHKALLHQLNGGAGALGGIVTHGITNYGIKVPKNIIPQVLEALGIKAGPRSTLIGGDRDAEIKGSYGAMLPTKEFNSMNQSMLSQGGGVAADDLIAAMKRYADTFDSSGGEIKTSLHGFANTVKDMGILTEKESKALIELINKEYIEELRKMRRSGTLVNDSNNPLQRVSQRVVGSFAGTLPQQRGESLTNVFGQFDRSISAIAKSRLTQAEREAAGDHTSRKNGGSSGTSGGVRGITLRDNGIAGIIPAATFKGVRGQGNFAHAENEIIHHIVERIKGVDRAVTEGTKQALKIASPSQEGIKIGKNLGSGLVLGASDKSIITQAQMGGRKVGSALLLNIESQMARNPQFMIAGGTSEFIPVGAPVGGTEKDPATGAKKKMSLKGKMGGGMGLMAGSMAMNSMGSNMPGGSLATGAMTGASLGLMFGPEGAAIGALAGLAVSGISDLIKAEQDQKTMSEATFKSSTSAVSMFGAAAQDTSSHVWNIKNNVDKLKTTIPGFHKQLNDFTDMVAKLPTDDPLSLVLKNIKNTADSGAAKTIAEAFTNTQIAINGLDPAKAKDLLNLMFASTGHSDLIGRGSAADNRAGAISKMIVDLNKKSITTGTLISAASYGRATSNPDLIRNTQIAEQKAVTTNKELVKTYKDLIAIAGNTKNYEDFKAIQDGITHANLSQSQSFQLLQTSIPEAKKKLQEYEKAGLDAGQAIAMLQAENLGLTGSFTAESLFGSNAVGFPGMGQKALKQLSYEEAQKRLKKYYADAAKAAADAAKPPSVGGDTTLGTLDILIAKLESSKQAFQDQKDALDKSIQTQKDYNDQLKKTQDYLTSTTDLENQVRMARAKGDYLQVGLLKQQLASKQTEFTSAATISPAEQQSQNLADRIAELTKQIQEANSQNKVIKKEIKAANKASGGYIPGYAKGSFGGVFGPGTFTSDSIPAYLSNGEYVLSANAVRNIPGNIRTLDKINGGDISSFSNSAVNNYSISVNVAGTNANPDQIAQAVLNTIQRRSNMNNTTRVI